LNKVVEKKKEENILSKLDEKQFEQYTKQALKKENQILDEMLVMKMNFKG
jgi:flagellar biosynthesis chaperone FliJ